MKDLLRVTAVGMAILSSVVCLGEKKLITLPRGYSVGEVTADKVNIRSGAGNEYPIATVKYFDAYVRQYNFPSGTVQVEPAYKGDLKWVKEEGDWYLIDPGLIGTENETPQYISKKFVRLIESDPFDFGEIQSPMMFISAYQEVDEMEEEHSSSTEVLSELIFYPKGLVVEYFSGLFGHGFRIGTCKNGEPAVKWKRVYEAGVVDEPASSGSRPKILLDETGTHVTLSYDPNSNRTATVKGYEVSFPDLSVVPAEEWVNLWKESSEKDESEVTELHYSDFPFFTRDALDADYILVK